MIIRDLNKLLLKGALLTRAINADEKSKITICSLLCHNDVLMYILNVKSFYYYLDYPCRIAVYDDGTLTEKDFLLLKKHIIGVEIIKAKEADEIVVPFLKNKKFNNCIKIREEAIMIRKLIDVNILSKTEKIITFDPDIFFFREPKEVKEWIENDKLEMMFTQERNFDCARLNGEKFIENMKEIALNLDIEYKKIEAFNAGFICFQKRLLDLKLIEKFFDFIQKNNPSKKNLLEQSGYFILASSKPSKALPLTYMNKAYENEMYLFAAEIKNPIFRHHYGYWMRYDNFLFTKDLLICLIRLIF